MELDFSPLLSSEAISTKGGGHMEYMDGQWYYMLDEVTVTGQDQSFDYGEWWSNVAAGAAGGLVAGGMTGGATGSMLGPAGTVGGAAGGAIIGTLVGAVGAGVTNYVLQSSGY